jgi:predicted transcriptional regulator
LMASEETLEAAAQRPGAGNGSNGAWKASMVGVMRQVLMDLPENTTLGEIVEGARANPQMAPVLKEMSIKQLIDIAVERPIPETAVDAEESGVSDLGGAAVIRRRSDVPNGDITVLSCLAERGAMSESSICRAAKLSSEQLRLILRGLRTKGYVHVEGSGNKRKLKVTRAGSAHLRKATGQMAPSGRGRRRRRR